MTACLKEQVVQQSPIGSFSSVKNATLVSLVCDNGIFNPSGGFFSAWPFMIKSMGRDLRKQNNYVCMYEAGLAVG